MKILGIDLGDARTGVAISDITGSLARGYRLIEGKGLKKTASAVAETALEEGVDTIVIGDPLHMDGTAGARSEKAHAFGKLLEGQLFARGKEDMRIVFFDERLTTVEAHEILQMTGNSDSEHRRKVDMLASELILQSYLNTLK